MKGKCRVCPGVDYYPSVVASAHQVFGTIGFTEDHILPLYTKRARAYEFSFGYVSFHLDKLTVLL